MSHREKAGDEEIEVKCEMEMPRSVLVDDEGLIDIAPCRVSVVLQRPAVQFNE